MGVPYEIEPRLYTVPGGTYSTFKVDFPSRSYINKIIVTQVDGTASLFTVELFNHADAMENTAQSASSSDAAGNRIPLENYRVSPPLTGHDGLLRYFSEETTGGSGLMFVCQDREPTRRGQVMRNLYVRIHPSGSGDMTFAVSIGGDSEVG